MNNKRKKKKKSRNSSELLVEILNGIITLESNLGAFREIEDAQSL
jgi:hypothetical protein